MTSEPNLWKIMKKETATQDVEKGLMLVYVDDLLVLSEKRIAQEVIKTISSRWDVSEPEWLSDTRPTKFLGVEIWEFPEGIFINQEKYLMDVLRRNGQEDGVSSGIPITKDQVQRLEEEDKEKSLEEVRQAQRVTGELMWMVTRSRPDLMYALSKMSQSTLKAPKEVVRVAEQVWKYLRKTKAEGIWFRREGGEMLEVFTDSSYGPNGLDSQGCVVVKYGGDVVMWRSGKQSVPALSTAESELGEAIEGLTMGDSIDVLIQEMSRGGYGKTIKVDNTAAVNLLTEPAGSWRTRHLRLRAAHLRWRLGRLDWLVESIPGEEQVADVGTKILSSPKLEALKKMMNMGKAIQSEETKILKEEKNQKEELRSCEEKRLLQKDEEEKKGEDHQCEALANAEVLQEALRMIVVAMTLGRAKAQEEEEEDLEENYIYYVVWAVCYMMVEFSFIGLVAALYWCWRRCRKSTPSAGSPQPEEEPEMEEEHSMEDQRGRGEAQVEREEVEERPSGSGEVVPYGGLRRRPSKGRGKGREVEETERREEVRVQAHHFGNEPEPLVVVNRWEPRHQRAGGRGSAFITTYGEKWHQFSNCGPLAQRSRPLLPSRWCPECAGHPTREFVPVYSLGRGSTVHYDSRCELLERGSKQFQKCSMCQMMEPILRGWFTSGLSLEVFKRMFFYGSLVRKHEGVTLIRTLERCQYA